MRAVLLLPVLATLSFAAPARAGSDLAAISASDLHAALYFREALEHPEINKLQDRKKQITRVAKDLKVKPKNLEAAVSKLESVGDPDELAKQAEQAIKRAAQGERVKGRILDVLLNTEEPKHAVLYVRWQASSSRDVVKEAATIAHLVSAETPFVSTLSLAAIHPKADKGSKDAVWSGKIGAQSMSTIQKQRIEDYGDKLYKRLFEGVEEKVF